MTDIPATSVDRTERTGSPWLIVLLALFLVGAAGSYSLLPPEQASRLTLAALALLALVGLVALFFYAVGFVQFAGQATRNDVTKIIADTNAEGLLVTEGESRIVYANETYTGMGGVSPGGDLRTVPQLFSGPTEVSEAVYRLAQASREGRRLTEEMRLSPALTGGGAVGWYRVRVRPVPRPGGVRGTLWTVADVTRERERHENVFQELQYAIDFLDHAPAGFFSLTADGRITYMNATLATWLDHDLAQVGSGGLTVGDIVASNALAMITMLTGAAGEVKTEQFDIDLKRRNGQSFPVRMLHRVVFSDERTPGPSRTLVINRAPGEEPAEDLRAAEVRFARLFNATPMAIASLSEKGEVTRSNAAFARLFGNALRGGRGDKPPSLANALIEADRAVLQGAVAQATRGQGDVPPLDVALRGSERWVRLFVSAGDTSPAGGAGAVSVFAMETTEQRNLQESFVQAQKMQAIGQLAGGVAHDFNNVLTAILGYSDLLLANHRATDPSFQDIMQIKQNANRAAGLVRQLLAFSRRQTLRPEVLQLGDVLSDLHNMMRRLVGEKIEIDVRHGRDLGLVKADLNQFEQVVINLVVNARDAMPDGGRITVRTRNVTPEECASFNETSLAAAPYVLVEISDNGTGIPPDVLPKIFEPFFTTKEVGKGTGLGLSTVYGIIKQTGGYVFCDSTVGQGTSFRILLPAHHAEPEAEPVRKAEKASSPDMTGRGTVLLVEDEEAVRAFGARALHSRGYTVIEASSGAEALQVVAEADQPIDLIVSDVVMPEMDGPTMFGELRKRGITAKVIFVSGYAEEAFARNLPEGETFGFLPKPFSLKQLVEAVKSSIAS